MIFVQFSYAILNIDKLATLASADIIDEIIVSFSDLISLSPIKHY